MKGIFVKHTHRGIGKVREASDRYLKVEFFETGEAAVFESDAFAEKELKYYQLPLKSICMAEGR